MARRRARPLDCRGFRYREQCRHLAVAAAVTTAVTHLVRQPARVGERPSGWDAPAIMDEGELLASIELHRAEHPDAEPIFFRRGRQ